MNKEIFDPNDETFAFNQSDQATHRFETNKNTDNENGEGGRQAIYRRRGIYLLPNLFTIAGLFAGFYAIVSAMEGYFSNAAISIFIAMIMDFFDGRVARLTNTQSAFGAELDSLSDMVSFGVAPALVVYSWSLESLGKLGWLAAFIFAAAGALRLARFNTQALVMDKRYFQGLPIPAAAGILASMVWLSVDSGIPGEVVDMTAAVLAVLAAILMVSNIRYYSFKEIDLKGRVPFVAILLVVLVFVGISLDPPKILFLIFFCYGISGPILTLWALHKKRSQRKKHNTIK
ncbi:CDP-diacylglycerol--serine O-phosphatidyltransferase [Rickettsiella endosymbiont of Dermanyssus gallinae]|uniref:CDP-diacylglycerol--serine O-phosphatidyltransferase n=1 Tax=Rickettsiella endosymbiont of Dermanyssus gallinae TaxID=2856608 RepID=UPI001C532A28|nr:CDP-diacylglycerol--serine O-phosphatidyltransferase [Rickettsiella endosymbiont of Dermanyssus gallinae]